MQRRSSEQQPTSMADLFRFFGIFPEPAAGALFRRPAPLALRAARMARIKARRDRLYTRDCPCEAVTIRVKDEYRTVMRAVPRRRPEPGPLCKSWRKRRLLELRAAG